MVLQTGRRFLEAAMEGLSRSNEKRLHGDYEGCPHSCFSQLPNTCSQHRLAKTKAKLRHNIHFYYKLNKLVSAV